MKKNLTRNALVLVAALILVVVSGMSFKKMHNTDKINLDNPYLTDIVMLSDYSPGIKDTGCDTEVYVFDSGKPGGKMLILGGTHPNEIAGPMNAITFIENVGVEEGTLYVLPFADESALTHSTPLTGYLDFYHLELEDGSSREFRIGSRRANPVHAWPDPNYYDGASTRVLKNGEIEEIRNLNRNYPGDPDGHIIEQVCYGIVNMINEENIDILYDAHEAGPRFPRVNYLIAHERAMPLASNAILTANINGLPLKTDLSGITSYGLSHRSVGDNTETFATLFETLNPAQGGGRSIMTEELVIEGKDAAYEKITREGWLPDDYGPVYEDGSPLTNRVAYHMEVCKDLAEALGEMYEGRNLKLVNLPEYDELLENGIAHYLKPVN